MHHVHFLLSESTAEFSRRTVPEMPHECGGFRFDEDGAASEGWLVCCDHGFADATTVIPRSRRILVISEPSPMNYLSPQFVSQFGILLSPYMVRGFRGFWFQSHAGLAWHFGAELQGGKLRPTLAYQDLVDLPIPAKTNIVSAVVSNKVVHEGHRRRLRFLELLQRRLGNRLVVFGRGIREVKDKAQAIMPYAYHLALENTVEPAYWSEKLADAYLGYALPIYAGCPDVDRWLPQDSLLPIDLRQPEQACEQILEAIDRGTYEARLPAVCKARRQILEQERIFDVVARAITAAPQVTQSCLTQPERIRSLPRAGIGRRVQRELHRAYHRFTFEFNLNQ